jgi:glucose-6-phosphate isomerase
MTTAEQWKRFQARFLHHDRLGISLDLSRVRWPDRFPSAMRPEIDRALDAMSRLEAGAIANPDEGRMVGHYWLRAPERAPDETIANQVREGVAQLRKFAADVHSGRIRPARDRRFRRYLLVGIGGSALGPQLAHHALSQPGDPLQASFFDNTDPDGFDRTLASIGTDLGSTLVVVVSKSGGTKETRNGMLEARAAWQAAGLSFPPQAVAITGIDSALDRLARDEGWLARFPMYDWIGGRTSQTSVVGLLPAALSGFDVAEMLAGARQMDEWTRSRAGEGNPAVMMAMAWYHLTGGRGEKDMVILPYKDRLSPLSRYLQQLVMESLGKERDLDGKTVHQGITVYGNKGSTDQHAYVQQLRDGVPNFFVTFVQVLEDRAGSSPEVEPGVTSGDYLAGFLLGTRQALDEKGRDSITLTLERVDERRLGAVVALYERTVGLYASLIRINAYHQPGVEAGKKAAGRVIELQGRILEALRRRPGEWLTAGEIAADCGAEAETETVFHLLRRLAADPARGVKGRTDEELLARRYSLAAAEGEGC